MPKSKPLKQKTRPASARGAAKSKNSTDQKGTSRSVAPARGKPVARASKAVKAGAKVRTQARVQPAKRSAAAVSAPAKAHAAAKRAKPAKRVVVVKASKVPAAVARKSTSRSKPGPKATRAAAAEKANTPRHLERRSVKVPTVRAPRLAKPLTGAPAALKLIGVRKVMLPASKAAPAELAAAITAAPQVRGTLRRQPPSALALRRADDCARKLGLPEPDAELRRALGAALSGDDALVSSPDGVAVAWLAIAAAEQIQQPTLLVSPLAANLRVIAERRGVADPSCVLLDASLAAPERSRVLTRIAQGGALLVLLAPAELTLADTQRALARSGIGLVVLDEAHACSTFAHELRPSLSLITPVLASLGRPPVLAATRPVPAEVRHDIAERLGLTKPAVALHAPIAVGLVLSSYVARGEVRQARLLELLQRLQAPGVIYCALPHDVDAVYAGLTAMRLPAHRHHAGLPPAERARELEAWNAAGRRAIMVATSGFAAPSGALGLGEELDPAVAGFGRGLVRRDVRFVIHYQAPPSLEQYVREVAIAGRDGERADAVLLYESAHRSLNDALLAQQRFRSQHLLDLSRALEAAAVDGRALTIEALALSSGQSRRTMDRLTALAADAGLVDKSAGWVRPRVGSSELVDGFRKLAEHLAALRTQDARRLDAMVEYAESSNCRQVALSRYFGLDVASCGRCSSCLPPSAAQSGGSGHDSGAPVRRPAVQAFGVAPAAQSYPPRSPERGASSPTSKLADFTAQS